MEKKKNSPFFFILLGILALVAGLLVYCVSFHNADTDRSDEELVSLNGKWTISRLDQNTEYCAYETEITLNKDKNELVFYSENTPVTIYVNDKEIYKYDGIDAFYGDKPASKWHFVSLPETKGTAEITVEGKTEGNPLVHSYYGSSRNFTVNILKDNWLGIIIVTFLIFIGIVLLAMHFAFHKVLTRQHSFMYMGLFAILSGIFIIFDSGLLTVLFENAGLVCLLCEIFRVLVIVPFMLYIEDDLFPGARRLFVRSVIGLYLAAFAFMCVLHFTEQSYLQDMRFYSSVACAVAYVCMTAIVVANCTKKEKFGKKNRIFLVSIIILAVTRLVDVFLIGSDFSVLSAVGALAVVIIATVLNMGEVTDTLKIGMKSKLVSKLAYTDGLTGVGNTTAFREKLDSLELTKVNYDAIGIVQLDINNLKIINDTLGHSVGDDLIRVGARVIRESFGTIGEVYRIGGDEFAVIVTCDHAPKKCDEAAARFEQILEEYNSNPKARFKLQIAYGIAFYRHDFGESDLFLREIQKQADVLMYNNKRQIKQRDKDMEELQKRSEGKGVTKDTIVM